MGRAAYSIAGGIIGAVVVGIATDGSATAQGYAAGFAIGSTLGGIAGSYIDPLIIQGNKIGDAQLQVAAEGGARALMYGRACVTATCVVARGARQVVKKKQSNGKGSSGSTESQTVTWTFAIGLGESLVGASICRIWQDENLVYDVLGDGAMSTDDNAKFAAKFKFYDGNEAQLPDPDLQAFLGIDTPYFRGTSYVVFPNFDLTATAERIPQFKFEILQGVAGIVDELETLGWSIPNGTVHSPSQSVTLTASSTATFNVDFFFTSDMEARKYSDPSVAVVGGGGRFITAAASTAVDVGADVWSGFNIYKVTISDPPQTYYVNNALAGEHVHAKVLADGSNAYKLSVQMKGNATITFSADDVNGGSDYYPQSGSVTCNVTGLIPGENDTIPLSGVIEDLLLKAGMTVDQFSASALTDQIAGLCIQQTVSGADAVGSTVAAFFADPTEHDAKLSWVKRGGSVLRTLTIEDLTEEPDVRMRENAIEYPAKLSFFYQSPLTGYEMTKATSNRSSPQSNSSGEGSVTSPVTFYDADIPAQIAQKLHKVAWTEAEGSFTWRVGLHCIDLVPCDVVGLSLRGIVSRARIISIENDGAALTLTMIKDRQSSYTSVVTGIPLPMPTPPQQTTMSKAVLAVLDIPALQDTDDSLLYYTAMSGSTSVWSGGELQRSLDGGVTWTAIGQVTTDVTMGKLTVAMTATSNGYTDTTNTVTVQLFDSNNTLGAFSETAFDQEQGAIAVQLADGTWEVMQYRDAEDGGSGLYTLTTLKRGRLTTVVGPHSVGALFVLLDQYLVKNAAEAAYIGGTMKHRAVSYSTSSEDATVVSTVYTGASQLEWAPASAAVSYDGATVAVTDIIPRERFGTEVNPIQSVNFKGFRVTANDGTTVDTGSTSAYFTMTIAPISVTIQALNKITGPGAALIVTAVETVPAGTNVPEAVINAGGA